MFCIHAAHTNCCPKQTTLANALRSLLAKHYPVHRSHTALNRMSNNEKHCQGSQILNDAVNYGSIQQGSDQQYLLIVPQWASCVFSLRNLWNKLKSRGPIAWYLRISYSCHRFFLVALHTLGDADCMMSNCGINLQINYWRWNVKQMNLSSKFIVQGSFSVTVWLWLMYFEIWRNCLLWRFSLSKMKYSTRNARVPWYKTFRTRSD